MVKRKKIIVIVMSVCLACVLFLGGGCAKTEAQAMDIVSFVSSDEALAYYQSVVTFPRSGPDYPDGINAYLLEQAKMLGIDAKKDKAGNVIMHAPATGGNEDEQPVVLLAHTGAEIANLPSVPFDPYKDGVKLVPSGNRIRASGTSMGADGALGVVTVLSVLKYSKSHGEIIAVFAKGTGAVGSGDVNSVDGATGKIALKGIPYELPENALLIEASGSNTNEIIDEAPTASVLSAKTTASAVQPGVGRAYVISASGFPAGAARVSTGKSYLNPISVIAQVLSETRNAGYVYDLCNFSGGDDAFSLPVSAQATVVLGDYEERQFRRVFNSVAEESIDTLGGQDSGVKIDMIETVRPDNAIGEDEVSGALTYLYGVMNLGKSDASKTGASMNIGKLRFDLQGFECGIAVVSDYSESDTAERIVNAQSAFERMSGIPVEKTGEIPGFSHESTDESAEPDDGAADPFVDAYKIVTGGDVKAVKSNALSPLGKFADSATIKRVGITVHGRGTPEEYFDKKDAAIPANVILQYFENVLGSGTEGA